MTTELPRTANADLISAATAATARAMHRAGLPPEPIARLRVWAPWRGEAVLCCNLAPLGIDPGCLPVLDGPLRALLPAGVGEPTPIVLDPAALHAAIDGLPAGLPDLRFPAASLWRDDIAAAPVLACLRTRAALAAARACHVLDTDRPPAWDGEVRASQVRLVRALLAATCASARPGATLPRLLDALDTQWREGAGTTLRLVDPHDPPATRARLALAARAAARALLLSVGGQGRGLVC